MNIVISNYFSNMDNCPYHSYQVFVTPTLEENRRKMYLLSDINRSTQIISFLACRYYDVGL